MAKPPTSPPSSDIEGANRDHRPIDGPAGVPDHPGHAEDFARSQSHGRPADTKR